MGVIQDKLAALQNQFIDRETAAQSATTRNAILQDPYSAAAKKYKSNFDSLAQRSMAVAQKQTQTDFDTGKPITAGLGSIMDMATALGNAGGLSEYNGIFSLAKEGFGMLGGLADRFGGGGNDYALGNAKSGAVASEWAGAMQGAQNDKMRGQIISQGQQQMDGYNTAAQNQMGQMTDSAIGQANAYQAGMQGIGQSGIEGSANMERNLQYGQDRADAQEQLAYDIMGQQAQGISDGMVQSFDQLSQNKAAVMQNAWGNEMNNQRAKYDNAIAQNQAYAMKNQPTHTDYEKAIIDAADHLPGAADTPDCAGGAGGAAGAAAAGGSNSAIDAWLQENHTGQNGSGWLKAVESGTIKLPAGMTKEQVLAYANSGQFRLRGA